MIIAFSGTKENRNNADALMVFTAASTMFQRQKKVIMLSLGSRESSHDLEMLADSAAKTEHDLSDTIAGTVTFEDNGVDALLRQASTSRLTEDHFSDYCTQYARARNYLDIAPMTTQRDFETLLSDHPEDIEVMLSNADEVYDYVFVLLDAANDRLMDSALKYVDRIVTVVSQGPVEKLPGTTSPFDKSLKKKRWYLVADTDKESAYGYRYMKKAYDSDNIFGYPHNVLLKDAVSDGKLIHFAMLNSQVKKQDTNYALSESVKKLMDSVSGVKTDTELSESLEKMESLRKEREKEKTLEELPENRIQVEERTKRHGFFGKKYTEKKLYVAKEEENTYHDAMTEDNKYDPLPVEETHTASDEPLYTAVDENKNTVSKDMETTAGTSAEQETAEEKPKQGIWDFFKNNKKETPAAGIERESTADTADDLKEPSSTDMQSGITEETDMHDGQPDSISPEDETSDITENIPSPDKILAADAAAEKQKAKHDLFGFFKGKKKKEVHIEESVIPEENPSDALTTEDSSQDGNGMNESSLWTSDTADEDLNNNANDTGNV